MQVWGFFIAPFARRSDSVKTLHPPGRNALTIIAMSGPEP